MPAQRCLYDVMRICLRGKMDNRIDLEIPYDLAQDNAICDTVFNQRSVEHRFAMAVHEVVQHNNIRSARALEEHVVTADITRTARDQDQLTKLPRNGIAQEIRLCSHDSLRCPGNSLPLKFEHSAIYRPPRKLKRGRYLLDGIAR